MTSIRSTGLVFSNVSPAPRRLAEAEAHLGVRSIEVLRCPINGAGAAGGPIIGNDTLVVNGIPLIHLPGKRPVCRIADRQGTGNQCLVATVDRPNLVTREDATGGGCAAGALLSCLRSKGSLVFDNRAVTI